MAVGKPLRLRLFLEGEEVPCVAAQISIGPNAPSAAAIQIVPIDEGMRFYPRTMVHLFFLDQKAVVGMSDKGSDPTVQAVTTDWKMIWEGEISGFSSVQTAQSRALVLQCLDFSNYWDSAHAMAIEYGPTGNAFTYHGFVYGGSVGTFDDISNFQPNKLVNWLNSTPETPGLQSVTGLAGGIIRMLEAMGGVPGHSKGVNDFFTVAELRCKILAQITAEENDKTAANVLDAKVMDEWIRNGLHNMGYQVTFRDMMKLLFQYIYYDFVPNPAPKWDPAVAKQTRLVPGVTTSLARSPTGLQVQSSLQTTLDDNIRALIGVGSKDTAAIKGGATVATDTCKKAISSLQSLSSSKASLAKTINPIVNSLTKAIANLAPALGTPTDTTNLSQAIGPIQDAINGIANSTDVAVTTANKTVTASYTQRLRTQIIRPDCWFAAPPRCNVIFPEMYTQFSYERNFFTEVTRMVLQSYLTITGPDFPNSQFILVPNIGDVSKELVKNTGSGTNLYRFLMDHEIHSGIIPRTERLSNLSAVGAKTDPTRKKKIVNARLTWMARAGLFHFFKYRFAARQASVGMRFNPFMVCGFPAVVIKKPYIVPGVSNADNSNDPDIVNSVSDHQTALDNHAPSQLVGMVVGLSHNIDQSGGTTQVSLQEVREHLTVDDDFLNIFLSTDEGSTNKIIKTSITFINAQQDPDLMKLLANCTPQQAASSSPSSVTQRSVSSATATGSVSSANPSTGTVETQQQAVTFQIISEQQINPSLPPPLTALGSIPGVNRTPILVPNPGGKVKAGSQNGRFAAQKASVVGVEVLDSTIHQVDNVGQVYGAVALYEQISVPNQGTLPIEEIIRPPWFSPAYANHNIGNQIYDLFFGCGSVVDDLIVEGISDTPQQIQSNPDYLDFDTSQTPDQVIQQLSSQAQAANSISIEKAITVLSYVYGQVKQKGRDVDEFIRSYIDRPIATMDQILGSDDLSFDYDSDGVVTSITAGIWGFHTGAIDGVLSKVGNYAGLVTDPELQVTRLNNEGSKTALSPRYDIREANKDRVLAYIEALTSRAFRG